MRDPTQRTCDPTSLRPSRRNFIRASVLYVGIMAISVLSKVNARVSREIRMSLAETREPIQPRRRLKKSAVIVAEGIPRKY